MPTTTPSATTATSSVANTSGMLGADKYYNARLRMDVRNDGTESALKAGVEIKTNAFLYLRDGKVEEVTVHGRLTFQPRDDGYGSKVYDSHIERGEVRLRASGKCVELAKTEMAMLDDILWRKSQLFFQDRAYNRMKMLSMSMLRADYSGSKRDKNIAFKNDAKELALLLEGFDYSIRGGHPLPLQWSRVEGVAAAAQANIMKEAIGKALDAIKTLPGTFWSAIYENLRRSAGVRLTRETHSEQDVSPDDGDDGSDDGYVEDEP